MAHLRAFERDEKALLDALKSLNSRVDNDPTQSPLTGAQRGRILTLCGYIRTATDHWVARAMHAPTYEALGFHSGDPRVDAPIEPPNPLKRRSETTYLGDRLAPPSTRGHSDDALRHLADGANDAAAGESTVKRVTNREASR